MSYDLTDVEWCFLDLLARASEKGMPRVSRKEILYSANLPDRVRVQFVFAALTMSRELIQGHDNDQSFSITDKGIALLKFRFGGPSEIADTIIYLPDRSMERGQ